MDPEEALRTGSAAVSQEWDDDDGRRLQFHEVRVVTRAVVDELLDDELDSEVARPARTAVLTPAGSVDFEGVQYAPLATSRAIENDYRGAGDALAQLPQELAQRVRETVEDWRAHAADPGAVRYRVRVEEEPVAEFLVEGSRRRYWVGLRSKKVLARQDPSQGLVSVGLKTVGAISWVVASTAVGSIYFESVGGLGGFFGSGLVLLAVLLWADKRNGGT